MILALRTVRSIRPRPLLIDEPSGPLLRQAIFDSTLDPERVPHRQALERFSMKTLRLRNELLFAYA